MQSSYPYLLVSRKPHQPDGIYLTPEGYRTLAQQLGRPGDHWATQEAHDCPVAERLIRRVKSAKRMLGDFVYATRHRSLAVRSGHELGGDLP
jgi:hypothetical protein